MYLQTIVTVLLFHVKKFNMDYQSKYAQEMSWSADHNIYFGFVASILPAYVKNGYIEKNSSDS